MSSKIQSLSLFLKAHNSNKNESILPNITHTRIGDKTINIYGGSYDIPVEELPAFYASYYDHVFINKNKEFLTERQIANGPILLDFDFKYEIGVDTRIHTPDHITDIIMLYLQELKNFYTFEQHKTFPIYVMEKPNVNQVIGKNYTKDGIHIIIGIQMDHTMQLMLRKSILKQIGETCDLPITNEWDLVLDEAISAGSVNWQLYGSQKPGNEAYELTQHYIIDYDETDGEFMMDLQNVDKFDFATDLYKLSAQYTDHPAFAVNMNILEEYNTNFTSTLKKIKSKTRLVVDDNGIENITDQTSLLNAVKLMVDNLKTADYFIKEIHEYTQILPAKYYEPGSHLLNRKVAFALKHTDERLFLSWVMLRSKASDFDYSSISDLYSEWTKSILKRNGGITKSSIIYWAKQDAYADYLKVKNSSVDHFVEESITSETEFDFATVLYHMFKDKYVCSSLINKQWYVFKNHRWEIDRGQTLRLSISRDMFSLYQLKQHQLTSQMHNLGETHPDVEKIQKRVKKSIQISLKLKTTTDKNNIMREAMELFYDNDFIKNMDSNEYLMCFTNGVVDFKNKTFRDGYPQDYITKTTGIPYITTGLQHHQQINEVERFMSQLFPDKNLNKYMWDHLASCLIGTNMNQTFNVYHGSGSNGKSILTDLMSHTLGEYKGTVPITLVTEKRSSIGGTSSEIMLLKGLRYAVMQEPSKDAQINEGVMKELTGGDPVQGRSLYCESEIFNPQFKLAVCTNALFTVKSNDEGTWRRFRVVKFVSTFVDSDKPTNEAEFIYPKDKGLKEKLALWAPVFASMLVQIAYKTDGIVEDCEAVLASSNKYRKEQDHISAFVTENIINAPGKKLGKREVTEQFKIWYQENQGSGKIPKGIELHEHLDKMYGKCKTDGKWHNIAILYPVEETDIDALEC